MTGSALSTSLTPPCGAVLSDRLSKAAMTERVADERLLLEYQWT